MFKNSTVKVLAVSAFMSAVMMGQVMAVEDTVAPDMVYNLVVDPVLVKTPLVMSAVKKVEKIADEGFLYFNIDDIEYRIPVTDIDVSIKQGDAFSVMYGAISSLEGKGVTLVITDNSSGFKFFSQTVDYHDVKHRIEPLIDRDSRLMVQDYQVMSPIKPMAETYEDILGHPSVQYSTEYFNDL